MLRNYFIIAFRNLKKHRFYTLINVVGLAIGIASCLIILLYVNHDLSYDRHHAEANRIYRVNCEIKFGPNHLNMAVLFYFLFVEFQIEFSEALKYVQIFSTPFGRPPENELPTPFPFQPRYTRDQ